MAGLVSTLNHIVPVLVIFAVFLLSTFLIKRQLFKYFKKIATRKTIKKMSQLAVGVATMIFILVVVVIFGFLSNPFERDEIKTIAPSVYDDSFKPATRAEIDKTNTEVKTRPGSEKEIEATKDNSKAFEESKNLFN